MNIEPVSSVMTFQAQTQAPKQKPAEKAAPADMDVTVATVERPVDNTTLVVGNAGEADGQGGQGAGGREQQPQQSQESVKKMVDQLNKKMSNSEAIFGIHEDTNRVTIKIVDKETKEVIKEYPPEKTLDMIAKVWEMAGILVDEKL